MTGNPGFLADPWTLGPMGLVLLLGVLAIVVRSRSVAQTLKSIAHNDQRLYEAIAEAEEHGLSTSGAARLLVELTGRVEGRAQGDSGSPGRWLFDGDPAEPYAAACVSSAEGKTVIAGIATFVGRSLTGIALVMTFGLIAWVLMADVSQAVMHAQAAPTEQTLADVAPQPSSTDSPPAPQGAVKPAEGADNAYGQLGRGVGRMGAKFAVSALGLLGSLLFGLVETRQRSQLVTAARRSIHRNRQLFVSHERYNHELLVAELQGARREAIEAESRRATDLLDALSTHAGQVREKLAGLVSIEVSVKEMGQEVSTHLGQVMKHHIANQISESLADLKAFADEAMERVRQSNVKAVEDVLAEVRAVREAVSEQSKGDVEKLLEHLRSTVATGYEAEARNMRAAMEAFGRVVPDLEAQLRRMLDEVGHQLREQDASVRRAQDDLLGLLKDSISQSQEQLSRFASRNDETGKAADEAVGRLLSQTQQISGELSKQMLESARELASNLSKTSTQGLKEVQAEVEQLVAATAKAAEAFRNNISAAQAAFLSSSASLQTSLQGMNEAAKSVRADLDRGAQLQAASREALTSFERASSRMGESATRIDDAIRAFNERIEQEQKLVAAQRDIVEQVLPVAIERYSRAVDNQAKSLQGSWESLADKVRRVVDGAGDGLADGVDELAGEVQSLRTIVTDLTKSGPGRR